MDSPLAHQGPNKLLAPHRRAGQPPAHCERAVPRGAAAYGHTPPAGYTQILIDHLGPHGRCDIAVGDWTANSPRAPLVLAFLRADALARRGALGDGVPDSLRAVVPVDSIKTRDDVLERPRWRPWDDGVEAWLASSAAAEG